MRSLILSSVSALIIFSMTPAASTIGAEVSEVDFNNSIGFYRDGIALKGGIEQLLAPIKTRSDLEQHLASPPASSPFKYLSPGNQQIFLASLKFGPGGLSSFSYLPLQDELTASQAYELLSLFGMQRITQRIRGLRRTSTLDTSIMTQPTEAVPPDYEGYACSSRATCTATANSICTSNC